MNWSDIEQWLSTNNAVQDAYTSGDLQKFFPEVHALFGVPQPEEHHPEIDSGVHTVLVLNHAKKISNKPAVWFAALCHDLGKALTPPSEWPKHIKHEENGLEPLKNVCTRFKIPNDVQTLAEKACTEHLKAHKALEIRPGNLIQWFEALDWFNNEQEFNDFLDVCEADACGRKGFENRLYLQRHLLSEVYNISKPLMHHIPDTTTREIALNAAVTAVKHAIPNYSNKDAKIAYLKNKLNIATADMSFGVC